MQWVAGRANVCFGVLRGDGRRRVVETLVWTCCPEDPYLPAIEEARGGTLVLEDIEALSDQLQARLLSVINEQGTPAETRIVAISNLQEQDRTCEDALRADLFYRLAALRITIPLCARAAKIFCRCSHVCPNNSQKNMAVRHPKFRHKRPHSCCKRLGQEMCAS